MRKRARGLRSAEPDTSALIEPVRDLSLRLEDPRDLDPLLERIGNARYVLLGEASHGTAEYYNWRTAISKRLIREHGFSFIAVEGDWPDCYRVNRYVKGWSDAGDSAWEVLHAFERWPTWVWANEEIVALVEWLRDHNARLPRARRIGFYGLDVYSLWESLYAVMGYLRRSAPAAVAAARNAFRCFEPYGEDAQAYARATAIVPTSCAEEVVALLRELRRTPPETVGAEREARFNAEQNAIVVADAERYYRTMVHGGPQSWNIRDRHMTATLERLMRFHGDEAKAIVWEHNTHIGDASHTDMASDGMVNVGQLVREAHTAADVVLVGFGSHHGSVIAGRQWEAPTERMPVPPAREGSWEDVLHEVSDQDKLLIFPRSAPAPLREPRGHRAIGVVYQPEYEQYGNYVPTVLPRRYDAFVYLDETHALHPLHVPARDEHEVPETYPTGV